MANLSDHRDSHLYPSHSFSISQERLIKPPVSYSVYTVFWGDVQNSLSGLVSQSVQSLHHVLLFTTPWTAACQASLSITNSWSVLKLMSIESVMPSNHLILCHPLLLLSSIFTSIRVFSNESVLCITWSKYWSFSFSISPSNEYSGLILFRMDWFDLLVIRGTLKYLLQQLFNTVEKHQFFGTQPLLLSSSHIST